MLKGSKYDNVEQNMMWFLFYSLYIHCTHIYFIGKNIKINLFCPNPFSVLCLKIFTLSFTYCGQYSSLGCDHPEQEFPVWEEHELEMRKKLSLFLLNSNWLLIFPYYECNKTIIAFSPPEITDVLNLHHKHCRYLEILALLSPVLYSICKNPWYINKSKQNIIYF